MNGPLDGRRGARDAEGDEEVVLVATLVCPNCGAETGETMPEDACRVRWTCPACNALLVPRAGDCCVFCSYADVPCPPRQRGVGDC